MCLCARQKRRIDARCILAAKRNEITGSHHERRGGENAGQVRKGGEVRRARREDKKRAVEGERKKREGKLRGRKKRTKERKMGRIRGEEERKTKKGQR